MKLTIADFQQRVAEAFDGGYAGEDRDQTVARIMAEFGPPPAETAEGDFRVYTLAELQELPAGAKLQSQELGPFEIFVYLGQKMARFPCSATMSTCAVSVASYPWDQGVRRLTDEEYQELLSSNEAVTA